MSRRSSWTPLLAAAVIAGLLPGMAAQASGKKMSITGSVIDSACMFTKDLSKPISPKCAKACATAGSPLVILSDDGSVYLPIDTQTPAHGQNSRLMKFAGLRVRASGEVYERGGSKAIAIETISEAKGTDK